MLVALITAGDHKAEIEALLSLVDHVGLLRLPSALPYFYFYGHCLLGSLLARRILSAQWTSAKEEETKHPQKKDTQFLFALL